LEYWVGDLFESTFNLKLWDYSDSKYNINGKVSLVFSIGWGFLAMFLIAIVHPFVEKYVYAVDFKIITYMSFLFMVYFIIDTNFSVVSIKEVRKNITILSKNYLTLSNEAINKLVDSMKRTVSAFPSLNTVISKKININLPKKIYSSIRIKRLANQVISQRKPIEEEYNDIVSDIICNKRFLELQNYYHHN
jgi:uncharacterized membrane protein